MDSKCLHNDFDMTTSHSNIDRLSMLNLRCFLNNQGSRHEHASSGIENNRLREIQYHRNIAVELNDISIEFYCHEEYATAMEFCRDATNALMIASDVDHSPFTDDVCKKQLASKIMHAKDRLYSMGRGDNTRLSTLGCSSSSVCILNGIKLDFTDSSCLEDDCLALMYNKGLIHMRSGSFELAQEMFQLVVSTVSTYGNGHIHCMDLFLAACNNLGWIYQRLNNTRHASDMFIKSLSYAYEQNAIHYDKCRLNLATILYNVGINDMNTGDYDRALQVLTTSFDIMIKELGENHPDPARILLDIGKVQHELGMTSDSAKSLLEVLKIRRMVFGNDHYLVAEPLYHLGILFETLGDYESASNAYEQTAQIEQTALGPIHTELATTLCSVGRVQYDLGEFGLALEAHKKALVIMEAISDYDPVLVANNLFAIGKLYRETGMIEESQMALSSSKKILSQLEPMKKDTKANILMGLVEVDLTHPVAAAMA